MTIFEIRPHNGGWQCFDAPGVQPYFVVTNAKQQAIDCAKGRLSHRQGEIRVFNAAGELEQAITFDEWSARQRV
jgi:hypothetical protein